MSEIMKDILAALLIAFVGLILALHYFDILFF